MAASGKSSTTGTRFVNCSDSSDSSSSSSSSSNGNSQSTVSDGGEEAENCDMTEDEEDEEESWVDWIKRSTSMAVAAAKKAGVVDWVEEQRRRLRGGARGAGRGVSRVRRGEAAPEHLQLLIHLKE